MNGIFYGVGVGPGDPELITIKALRIIENSDVIILPAKDKSSCRAYSIVESVYEKIGEKKCIFEPFPMTMNKEERDRFHAVIADKVIGYLNECMNVSFLTIGDPCIYSTFEYIARIVEANSLKVRTVRVSGIPSFCAVAARLGISLALDKELIHVIPGSYDAEEALLLEGTKIFMKSGKRLLSLKKKLIEYELNSNAVVMSVSNCGMDNEVVSYNANDIPTEDSYLTVVIVR